MRDTIMTRSKDKPLNGKKSKGFTYCVKRISKTEGRTVLFNSFHKDFSEAFETLVICSRRASLG